MRVSIGHMSGRQGYFVAVAGVGAMQQQQQQQQQLAFVEDILHSSSSPQSGGITSCQEPNKNEEQQEVEEGTCDFLQCVSDDPCGESLASVAAEALELGWEVVLRRMFTAQEPIPTLFSVRRWSSHSPMSLLLSTVSCPRRALRGFRGNAQSFKGSCFEDMALLLHVS